MANSGIKLGERIQLPQSAAGVSGLPKVGGLLAKGLQFASPISAAIGAIGPIASLFRKSPEGLKKIKETKTQTGLETSASDVARRVREGSLDPDIALSHLQSLLAQSADDPGGIASISIQNAITDVQDARKNLMNEPLDQNPDLRGSEGMQGARLRTAMRNSLTGSGLGVPEGSPLSRVFKGSDVLGSASKAHDLAGNVFKAPDRSGIEAVGELLRKRLK